ncbi:MAG TPA: ubiquitin-like small modifier protein 1 [Bacillota bacterium]
MRVYIPTPYRDATGGRSEVTVDAGSVRELAERLVREYPDLRRRIFDDDGRIAHHLNVYVNGEEIRSLQGEGTALGEDDEVALIPAMAGGSREDAGRADDGPAVLTDDQLQRYSRHILLEEVGIEGQARLLRSKVAIIGAGGLGAPAAVYLAAAGVGTLGIIDADRVDLTNLQRQILHFTHDVGRFKTQSARRHLEDLNPDVRVVEHRTLITSANALEILGEYDLVINGSDNFPTRYLVNDACVMLGKPLVDASILKFEGHMTVFAPGTGCYRCLYPSPPPPGMVPSCAQAGILGALAGHMGTLQALEAVKVLLGIGEPMTNRLLIFDALAARYHTLKWRRNPACPVCGDEPTIRELVDYEAFCGMPLPRASDAEIEIPAAAPVVTGSGQAAAVPGPDGGEGRWAGNGTPSLRAREAARLLRDGELEVLDVREPQEFRQIRIPGSRLLPLGALGERVAEIDPGRRVLMVCTVGERSGQAVRALRRAGFANVYNLKGGLMAWLNERLPTESGEPA